MTTAKTTPTTTKKSKRTKSKNKVTNRVTTRSISSSSKERRKPIRKKTKEIAKVKDKKEKPLKLPKQKLDSMKNLLKGVNNQKTNFGNHQKNITNAMDKFSVNMDRIDEIEKEEEDNKQRWGDFNTVTKTLGELERYHKKVTNLQTKKRISDLISRYEVQSKHLLKEQAKKMTEEMKTQGTKFKPSVFSLDENDELVEEKKSEDDDISQKSCETQATSNTTKNQEKEPRERSMSPKRKNISTKDKEIDSPSKVQKTGSPKNVWSGTKLELSDLSGNNSKKKSTSNARTAIHSCKNAVCRRRRKRSNIPRSTKENSI